MFSGLQGGTNSQDALFAQMALGAHGLGVVMAVVGLSSCYWIVLDDVRVGIYYNCTDTGSYFTGFGGENFNYLWEMIGGILGCILLVIALGCRLYEVLKQERLYSFLKAETILAGMGVAMEIYLMSILLQYIDVIVGHFTFEVLGWATYVFVAGLIVLSGVTLESVYQLTRLMKQQANHGATNVMSAPNGDNNHTAYGGSVATST